MGVGLSGCFFLLVCFLLFTIVHAVHLDNNNKTEEVKGLAEVVEEIEGTTITEHKKVDILQARFEKKRAQKEKLRELFSPETKEEVDNIIKENDVLLFVSNRCAACNQLKDKLYSKQIDPKLVWIEQFSDRKEETKKYIEFLTDQKSLPVVFYKGEYKGSFHTIKPQDLLTIQKDQKDQREEKNPEKNCRLIKRENKQ